MTGGSDVEGRARVLGLIAADPWRLECLAAVRELGLADCWIGAGFVRSLVWDHLHGHDRRTAIDDVDVLYFDARDLSREAEAAIEQRLGAVMAGVPWSVKNQARMHLRNGDACRTLFCSCDG